MHRFPDRFQYAPSHLMASLSPGRTSPYQSDTGKANSITTPQRQVINQLRFKIGMYFCLGASPQFTKILLLSVKIHCTKQSTSSRNPPIRCCFPLRLPCLPLYWPRTPRFRTSPPWVRSPRPSRACRSRLPSPRDSCCRARRERSPRCARRGIYEIRSPQCCRSCPTWIWTSAVGRRTERRPVPQKRRPRRIARWRQERRRLIFGTT
mmetsp:Transcript_7604/g.22315  ORF Transcript_7604/g.22315 Transcript_7604/m.22315 type:complete len:207 (-) Transcript_7604:161-781(-)